jgi:16S rRNA processing protein RimM
MGPDPAAFMIVGRVRNAHGLRGELVIEVITDAPDAVFAPGRRVFAGTVAGDPAPDARTLEVVQASPFKGGLRVRFAEIADRTEAENWRERYLLIPSAEGEPLGEGEVYLHDLPGMTVELESGQPVGVVREVYELPQGIMLEVDRGSAASSVMIQYDPVVSSVDREARRIQIAPPDGLLD